MYIQWFAKGISGLHVSKSEAFNLVASGQGIISNWWRTMGLISPAQVAGVLTETNLDRHLHAYSTFGARSPFISLASGCVERDALLQRNWIYSAVDTALEFATEAWDHPGAVFYGWTVVSLNPAVPLSNVSESVRELNVYRRWSPFQLEGEITAKVHLPANQLSRVEWWDPKYSKSVPEETRVNPLFEQPEPITNVRELF